MQTGLDSIVTYSHEMPEMGASFEELDVTTLSVSSRFLCLVSTISDTNKLQLAPSSKSHELWCQARALLLLYHWQARYQSKLIHCFFNQPAAFGFWSSLPPDNTTLNLVNKKTDQSLSDFQTGIGVTSHATLDTEQLTSDTRTAIANTITSLQDSDGAEIPVQEVLELLTKIHDILERAVSK